MSIVSASRLSAADLARLSNNLSEAVPSPQRRRRRRVVAAVNRSLSTFGEKVGVLHPLPLAVFAVQRSAVAVPA